MHQLKNCLKVLPVLLTNEFNYVPVKFLLLGYNKDQIVLPPDKLVG